MKKQQTGYITLTVGILLTIMLITTLSLAKSSGVATAITGNLAFKQAAQHYTDIGVTTAVAYMNNTLTDFESNSVDNAYYAQEQAVDSNGIPSNITWSSTPSISAGGGKFTINYVIERMCDSGASLPISNSSTSCLIFTPVQSQSNNSGSSSFSAQPQLYYRVTVRVTGPSNTVTYVQSMILR